MADVYARTVTGTPPVTLEDVKAYLRITTAADDGILTLLNQAITDFVEKYTRRDLRVNTWTLTTDAFLARTCLRRDPVAAISSITYLVSGSPVTIASSVYYLKKDVQASEVLLQEDQDWPSDLDDVEAGIVITFTTSATEHLPQAKLAILRLIAWLYENRGDCDVSSSSSIDKAVAGSGAAGLLNQFRVARV